MPHQPANQTRAHPVPCALSARRHAAPRAYAVLAPVSRCYPPVQGRLPTRYSPVRHSDTNIFPRRFGRKRFVRLACVRHAASVHPEPGSNSHVCLSFSRPPASISLAASRLLSSGSRGSPRRLLSSEFFLSEFSGLHCCSLAKVRLLPLAFLYFAGNEIEYIIKKSYCQL